jgi:hypothetical protein
MARSPFLVLSAVLVGSAVGVLAAALWPGDEPGRVQASRQEAPPEEGGRVSLWIRTEAGAPELRAASARVRSEHEAELRPLAFVRPGEGPDAEPAPSATLAAGTPYLSQQALAPGDYRLRVAAEGFTPAEVPCRIQPGRVTEVEVVLSAD